MKTTTRFILVLVLALSTLTACGNKTTSASSAASSEFFEGEGKITGGIKSEEEIAALQEEEAEAYAESEEETITAADLEDVDLTEDSSSTDELDDSSQSNYGGSGSYVDPADFWEGDDYFDLEGYLYANGADWVRKGNYDLSTGKFIESDTDIVYYKAQFNFPCWMVTVGPVVEFEYFDYLVDGETWFGPYYVAESSSSNQYKVVINDIGSWNLDTTIKTLTDMLFMTKQYPDTENPFQYSEKINQLYRLHVIRDDIPENAVHR